MKLRIHRLSSETALACLILFTMCYIFIEKTFWLERARFFTNEEHGSVFKKSKKEFEAHHLTKNNDDGAIFNMKTHLRNLRHRVQRSFGAAPTKTKPAPPSHSYPPTDIIPDMFGDENMLRAHGSDPGCFFLERLETWGLPVVHSIYADHVDRRVVISGIRRPTKDYSWSKEVFLCEFYPEGFVLKSVFANSSTINNVSIPIVIRSDPIIPDIQRIGARPQGVVIITCNIPTIIENVDMFKMNIRRESDPHLAYENITVCRSLVNSYKKRFLSICTMLKDMNRYVADWLEYHKNLGVEKAYIYDNARTSTLHKWTDVIPYLQSGFLTIIPWSHRYSEGKTYLETQIASENDCLWRHRHDSTWMIKTDVDEFLQPVDPSFPTWLPTYLNQSTFSNLAAVRLQNWFFCQYDKKMQRKKRRELGGHGSTVFERNQYRGLIPTLVNKGRDKSIVRPDMVHYFKIHAIKWGGDILTLNPHREIRMVHYRGDNPRHPTFCPKMVVKDTSMFELWKNITGKIEA